MESSSTPGPGVQRIKSTARHRSVSPRLNQLLQLFQSKANDQTPTRLLEKEGTSLDDRKSKKTIAGPTDMENNDGFKNIESAPATNHGLCYPRYNSSLKKSMDLDRRLGYFPSSHEKSSQVCQPHSRTPYTRETPSRKSILSRQKSFQKSRDTDIIKETNYEREETPAEKLRSVNLLLKGSTSSCRQESKDQGYFTDTSIKSLDNETHYNARDQGYNLKSPEPSLDEIMQEKLDLGEKDNLEYKEDVSPQNRVSKKSEQFSYHDDHNSNAGTAKANSANFLEGSPDTKSQISYQQMNNYLEEDDLFSDSFRTRSLTDSTLKIRQKRPLSRSRSALVIKPPRRLCVSESEGGIQLDENGVLQIVNDIKNMKTSLLKLKRELQEVPLLSPLSNLSSSAQRFFDDSFITPSSSSLHDGGRKTVFSDAPRKLVRRTTMDSCVLRRIQTHASDSENKTKYEGCNSGIVTKQSSQVGNLREEFEGFPSVEKLQSVFEKNENQTKQHLTNVKDYKEENEQFKKELSAMKNEMEQLRQERNCHLIAREELEHELDSKNYTIKLLQTQLEGQEFRDEVESLKEQVKALKTQYRQQQDEIFRLANPGIMAPDQADINLKSNSHWTDLRLKLKDAMMTAGSPPSPLSKAQHQTISMSSRHHTPENRALTKSEVE